MNLLKNKNNNHLRLIHVLGNHDEKNKLYQNGNCPDDIINDVIDSYSHDKSFYDFIHSLTVNPAISSTQLLKIESSPIKDYGQLARKHPNHPNFNILIAKEIEKKCLKPLQNFIKDDVFFNNVIDGGILAGTSISSLTRKIMDFEEKNNDGVKDWDIYFYKKEILDSVIKSLLNKFIPIGQSKIFWETISPVSIQYNDIGAEFVELREFGSLMGTLKDNPTYDMVITNNAISIQERDGSSPGYQFILTIHNSEPEKIVSQFDYLHCQSFYQFDTQRYFSTPEINHAVFNKQLIFKGGLNPLSSIVRMKKFGRRGWSISQLQILKILAFASEAIDFNNAHMVQSLLRGFYLESKYPELMNMPVNEIKNVSELMNYLDTVTFSDGETEE